MSKQANIRLANQMVRFDCDPNAALSHLMDTKTCDPETILTYGSSIVTITNDETGKIAGYVVWWHQPDTVTVTVTENGRQSLVTKHDGIGRQTSDQSLRLFNKAVERYEHVQRKNVHQ
jgi:hypothetical protein